MRESNFAFPSQNRACVCITSALYDRRALDTTAALPLLNSLTHLTYLTSTSPRIREILTLDGGLERLLHILRNSSIPRPPPPPPDLYGLSINPAIPASTGLLSPDRAVAYRFSLAFQCVSNVGVRGSEQIRTRVVQAGVLDVVAQVLEVWLRSRGMSTEAGPSGSGQPLQMGNRVDPATVQRPRVRGPTSGIGGGPVSVGSAGMPVRASSTIGPDGSLVVVRPAAQGAVASPVPARPGPPPSANATSAPPQPAGAGPSLVTQGLNRPSSPSASIMDTSRPSSATSEARAGGSFPNSGDETSINDGEMDMGDAEDPSEIVLTGAGDAALAASDEETGRLAQSASNLLQSMASNTTFVSSRTGLAPEDTPRGGSQALSSRTPSTSSNRRPSPIRSGSTSTTGTDNEYGAAPVAIQLRQLDNLSRPALTGNASEASSAGGSNVSTPMGTPTGNQLRERSGTLIARPVAPPTQPARRRRRERTSTPGNDSTTTGGEDDGRDLMDGEDEDGDQGGAARQLETGAGPLPGSQEVNIVQEEDGATDIETNIDETLEGNMDMQMGAPPGAPGAANTPRAAPDMTPRQVFLPMTAVPAVPNIGPSVTSPVAQTAEVAPANAPGRLGTTVGFAGMQGMAAPAVVALATAQATQRTLRDLSLEGNTMSPSETTYRDDDILLSLQLLAYLSKYPHVRQAFHKPRQPFHPNLELSGTSQTPLPMRPALSDTPNIFSLVERFTFRPSPSDPTSPQLPDEIVYWAGVIMRNACRKDESRGGIRQCANMSCGKWETSPRQFAKCRRCRKAKYCSKECQSKAWSEGHRFWCSQRGETEVPSTETATVAAPGSLGSLTGVPTIQPTDAPVPGRRALNTQPPGVRPRAAAPRPAGVAPTEGESTLAAEMRARIEQAPRRPPSSPNPPINIRAPSVDHTMDVDPDPRHQPVPPTPRPAPVARTAWTPSAGGPSSNPALGNPEDVNGVPLLAPGSATFRPVGFNLPRMSPRTIQSDLPADAQPISRSASPSSSSRGAGNVPTSSSSTSQSGSAFSRLTNALPQFYRSGHQQDGAVDGGGDASPARRSLFRALSSNNHLHASQDRERPPAHQTQDAEMSG